MSPRVRHAATRVFALCCTLLLTATAVEAQEFGLPEGIPARTLSPLFAQAPAPALTTTGVTPMRRDAEHSDRGLLIPLYVSFASLQMLDAHSTMRAMRAGGVEQNPMMRGLADKPAALVALKAGVAATTIALTDRMRHRNKVGAIVLMAALNSAYAVVVAHNYRAVP